MPDAARSPYQYAIVRVVPSLERGERINVGIVLLCRPRRYLGAWVELDAVRLRSFAPELDLDAVQPHLEAIERVARGDPAGGPIARLGLGERFHWLVSPASTIIQVSAVHTGLCLVPAAELDHLVGRLVK
ncbi:MAG: DUF3037 domain-containing protein [Candidatus Limnocylindrales bacterium]